MSSTINPSEIVLDVLVAKLYACSSTPDGWVRPAAILWPDPDQQWLQLKPVLLRRLPELIVLGPYDPDARTGPAIWVRCVVDGSLAEPRIPEGKVPIVYMPGVSRHDLRAGEDCPEELQPLVELLYRGTVWYHPGGHDWTVTAFFASPHGLGLDLARDHATREALLRALPEMVNTPVYQWRGHQLHAADFDRLLTRDVTRELLSWMNDPTLTKERMGVERWEAFRNQCRQRFHLDPEVDGVLTAGERLGLAEGAWAEVWDRVEEAPTAYSAIPDLLRRARPTMRLDLDPSRWPDINDHEEQELRTALSALKHLKHSEACARVVELEAKHGVRRNWIWARLGHAPMATVLEHLARVARWASSPLGGSTPEEIAARYVQGAWEADAASWEAVASSSVADERLVKEVIRVLLEPWLDESAHAFQRAFVATHLPGKDQQNPVSVEPGGCLLFTDGLRYDVACRLAQRLEGRGYKVHIRWRWAAVPTVTATAKPAVLPVAHEIAGGSLPEDFTPTFSSNGKTAHAQALRDALGALGYQIMDNGTDQLPEGDEARGWMETGILDQRGHDLQEELARQIPSELERLVERIAELFTAGWKSVRVVTDHGWLLLPGGLPKVDLPKHLTASRWKRCAVIAGQSEVDVPTVPWYWNSTQRYATAPGVSCFNASPCYAHGGLSVQECLIPDLLVEPATDLESSVRICSVTWYRMRCFVEVSFTGTQVYADLRRGGPKGPSVVSSVKALDQAGTTSLVVVDESYEDEDLVLVLLDQAGEVLTQRKTRVGVSS